MTTQPSTCQVTRKDGQPCRANALASGYCFAHDPQLAATRTAARAQGGRGKSKIIRLRKLAPPELTSVFDQLRDALTNVLGGKLKPQQATAAAAVATAMTRVLQAAELEQRVRDLEARQAEADRTRAATR